MAAISLLRWSPEGTRVITGDTLGTVAVWRPDGGNYQYHNISQYPGRMYLLQTYRKNGIINRCSFLTYPSSAIPGSNIPNNNTNGSSNAWTTSPQIATVPAFGVTSTTGAITFLLATETGIVFYADDNGRCADVLIGLQSPIDVLEYDPLTSRLVVITRTLLMAQLGFLSDGRVLSLSRAKVSVKGGTRIYYSCMTNQSTLVTASNEEPFLRCWDLAQDETYLLSITASGNSIPRHERIHGLAYSAKTGLLSAGTDSGQIYLWRHHNTGNSNNSISTNKSNTSQSWEPITNLGSAGTTACLSWGFQGSLLAVGLVTGEVICILSASMKRKLIAPVSIIQLSNREVIVERREESSNGKTIPGGMRTRPQVMMIKSVPSNGTIRGVDATPSHVMVWTAKGIVEIYALPDTSTYISMVNNLITSNTSTGNSASSNNIPILKLFSHFRVTVGDVAIAGDSIFSCSSSTNDDNTVYVHNFQGTVKHTISFGETEGTPLRLDTYGKYIVIVTSKGFIRVYDVTRVEPRLLASSKLPHGMMGNDIERIRINIDGTKVGIIGNIVMDNTSPNNATSGTATVGNKQPGSNSLSSSPSSTSSSSSSTATRLLLWSVESDAWYTHTEFSGSVTNNNGGGLSSLTPNRIPIELAWDGIEPRLVAVQTQRLRLAIGSATSQDITKVSSASNSKENESGKDSDDDNDGSKGNNDDVTNRNEYEPETEIIMFFATAEGEIISNDTTTSSASISTTKKISTNNNSTIGLVIADKIPLEPPADSILGIHVPYIYTMLPNPIVSSGTSTNSNTPNNIPVLPTRVSMKTFRDFVGIEDADESIRKVLLDFSFFMACGNTDEAYRAVKSLPETVTTGSGVSRSTTSVWEGMAAMCVKSGRLDVALICLGHMAHARGAAAVRALAHETEAEANLSVVAVQLGLFTDAIRQLSSCGRMDLLANLYRDSGLWEKAFNATKRGNRINLRSLFFTHARYLEGCGDIQGAITAYEAAGAHLREVPRMLHAARDFRGLATYIDNHPQDIPLQTWYAQYFEAQGDLGNAKRYYTRANDIVSLVRLLCAQNDLSAAIQLISESNNHPAAAYHLARHYEGLGVTSEALRLYELSGRYTHAVRLAKSLNADTDIMRLALRAESRTQLDTARYFEKKNSLPKAVTLYHRAGATDTALNLCFQHGLFDELRMIADEVGGGGSNGGNGNNDNTVPNNSNGIPTSPRPGSSTDDNSTNVSVASLLSVTTKLSPEMLRKCADFFIQHGQFEKAVSLLITAKRFDEAIEMAMLHRVTITEAMAETMTPPKPESSTVGVTEGSNTSSSSSVNPLATAQLLEDEKYRTNLLMKLAQALKRQGSYHLACKKYTQAGDKVKAMKALLKSGDTEKIIFFAQVSRSKEIFILAANYLQSLSWHSDPELLKSIIDFYSKARAYEQLSSFYEACSLVEIDEFRNYEKALAALREAVKIATKIPEGALKEARTASLSARVALVERFVQARKLAKTDTAQMVSICQQLTEQKDAETAIRVGDVYALLIYFFAQQRNWQQAYSTVESMRNRHIAIGPFVDEALIETIYGNVGIDPRAVGVLESHQNSGTTSGTNQGNEVEEDIPEEKND